jgi:hypothetical protein
MVQSACWDGDEARSVHAARRPCRRHAWSQRWAGVGKGLLQSGDRPRYNRRPSLLQAAAVFATSGGRPCYKLRRPLVSDGRPLLQTAATFGTSCGRPCYMRRPNLLHGTIDTRVCYHRSWRLQPSMSATATIDVGGFYHRCWHLLQSTPVLLPSTPVASTNDADDWYHRRWRLVFVGSGSVSSYLWWTFLLQQRRLLRWLRHLQLGCPDTAIRIRIQIPRYGDTVIF